MKHTIDRSRVSLVEPCRDFGEEGGPVCSIDIEQVALAAIGELIANCLRDFTERNSLENTTARRDKRLRRTDASVALEAP